MSELTLWIGLYPGGGRGTSFITTLEDSTEWPLLDFLLLEELGRESACLLQDHAVYGTCTLNTYLIYIYCLKNSDSVQPQTVILKINLHSCVIDISSQMNALKIYKGFQSPLIRKIDIKQNALIITLNQIIQKTTKNRINISSIFFFLLAVLMTNTCTGLFVMQLHQNILSDCFPVVLWISRIALKTLPAIFKA